MQEFALLALIMILALGAYWAMVIFPKQRDFQKRQQLALSLSPGDEIVTYGGLIGKIISIEADKGIVYIEIANGVVVRVLTAALVQPYDAETFARAAQVGIRSETPTTPES
jgi:preprotein translocase subunit YajC